MKIFTFVIWRAGSVPTAIKIVDGLAKLQKLLRCKPFETGISVTGIGENTWARTLIPASFVRELFPIKISSPKQFIY